MSQKSRQGRTSSVERMTGETKITVSLNLDGEGTYSCHTGIGFFDHMLDEAFKQTRFSVAIAAEGDLEVDGHHTVEDTGIALGKAFAKALGDGAGICRYGFFILPMDEALSLCAIDISGRGACFFDASIPAERLGQFDTELAKEFFIAFARESGMTLHLKKLEGENSHHILEGLFKSFGRALDMACAQNPRLEGQIPSTKGVLL